MVYTSGIWGSAWPFFEGSTERMVNLDHSNAVVFRCGVMLNHGMVHHRYDRKDAIEKILKIRVIYSQTIKNLL